MDDGTRQLGTFVACFLLGALVDVLWAGYIRGVSRGAPMRAALFAGAITLVGSLGVLIYVRENWAVLPMALGASVGTWLAVKRAQ